MVSLKLLIDKKYERVVFAEAAQDFVDFFFYLLNSPIGPVIKLLNCNKNTAGFCQSISDFRNVHFQYDQRVGSKYQHSYMHITSSSLVGDDWWFPSPTPTTAKFYYTCGGMCVDSILSPVANGVCNKCGTRMDKIVIHFVIPKISTKAPVNAPRRFMITDDLVVTPWPNMSTISLLNKFNIKDASALEEKDVQIGMDEGAQLLKHALRSKTVLTDLFLAAKGNDENLQAEV